MKKILVLVLTFGILSGFCMQTSSANGGAVDTVIGWINKIPKVITCSELSF